MLDRLREVSINLWSPVGDIFSSIGDSSNIWFPIISYVLITIVTLILLKKILDMTVSGTSSLSLTSLWSFLKKLILYFISIGITLAIVITLYFYLESIYFEHEKVEDSKQSLDYLLR